VSMKRFKDAISPREQRFLLPPSVEEFVEPEDPTRLIGEVVDGLDLSAFEARYRGGGAPSYPPKIMLKVLLLAYSEGIRSSRRIEQALKTDLRFMYLSEMHCPDYRTILRFRGSHEQALRGVFVEVVQLCQALGLVLMRHVSVDGTKIQANVSGRETYGRARLERALASVEERIDRILREAKEADASEEAEYGDARGDELPEDLRDAQRRKERLEAAKRKLKETGHAAVPSTDLEARVMRTTSGNRPAYNAQAVVDEAHQVIVAAEVTDACCDNGQLRPMVEAAKVLTGVSPDVVTADCGYHSLDALEYVEETGLNAYVPVHGKVAYRYKDYEYDEGRDVYLGRGGEELTYRGLVQKRGKTYRWYHALRREGELFLELYVREDGRRQEAMHRKVSSPQGQSIYRLRAQIVEPVFGHIKTRYGLRQFLLRGRSGANTEFLLACIAHNIGKLRRVWPVEGVPATP
jgi:transposase